MTQPDPDADDRLLLDFARRSNGRLDHVRLVRSGVNFVLAAGTHVPSAKQVLLTIARPAVPASSSQLLTIARLLTEQPHPDIGSITDKFTLGVGRVVSGLATTWHLDSRPLDKVLISRQHPLGGLRVVAALRAVADQLAAMHRAGYAHGDLSIGNVVVTQKNSVHLVDFEHATSDRVPFSEEAFYTPGYTHPGRLAAIRSGAYTLADLQIYDKYAFGKLILAVLSIADPYNYPDLSLLTQRALRMIACMCLDGKNTSAETAVGLSAPFFVAEQFHTLTQVSEALARFEAGYPDDMSIPELRRVPDHVVEVGSIRPAPFTRRTKALVNSPEMKQIASCQQLGLISFIWPTATHTRAEHALGTYATLCAAVSNLYADPQSPFFRVLITPERARALLAAGLLHDVGHYPLAHDLEEAYGDAFDHESRSEEFIQSGTLRELLELPEPSGWAVRAADVASIIRGMPLHGSTLSAPVVTMLHSIISGTIDVDKLDYLVRDSARLGVAAGAGIDVARVLSSLTIACVPASKARGAKRTAEPEELRLAVRAKGVRPAELVGRIRSHMFGVVYWHHSYRAIKAMIHWIIWSALVDEESLAANERRSRLVVDQFFKSLDGADQLETFDPQWNAQASLPAREGGVLAQFVTLGGGRAQGMLSLLREHQWYRAVLTVDHPDNIKVEGLSLSDRKSGIEDQIWATARKLPIGADEAVSAKVSLAHDVQSRIAAWFADKAEGETGTTVERWESQKMGFIQAVESEQLFLIDFVETRKSHERSARQLYYLVHERADSKTTDTSVAIGVRQSYDHVQLQKEFMAANGAIRLFCHPSYSRFVTRSIPQSELLRILDAALRAIVT